MLTVFVDTSEFIELDFESEAIAMLKRAVERGAVRLLTTRITNREVDFTLTKSVVPAIQDLRRIAKLPWLSDDARQRLVAIVGEEAAYVARRKQLGAQFLQLATLVPCVNFDVSSIVDKYERQVAPFQAKGEGKKEKRAEFQDAMVLGLLDQWAIANNEKVYVVSKDDGFQKACDGTNLINIALNAFLHQVDETEDEHEHEPIWHETIHSAEFHDDLYRHLADECAEVAASIEEDFDSDAEDIELVSLQFDPNNFVNVETTPTSVHLAGRLQAKIAANASVSDYANGTIDGETGGWGFLPSNQHFYEQEFELDVFLELDASTGSLTNVELATDTIVFDDPPVKVIDNDDDFRDEDNGDAGVPVSDGTSPTKDIDDQPF